MSEKMKLPISWVCLMHFDVANIDNVLLNSPGGIPLRHLVYRVLDLPPSMRPLVYDFGQLKSKTESQYIFQVVSNHVSL